MPITGSRAALRYTGSAGGYRQGTRSSGAESDPTAGALALTPVAGGPAGSARTDTARVPPQPQPAAGDPHRGDEVAATESSPTTIYSAGDFTVQPAVLTKPQLLPPPFGDGVGKPIRLELIVSADGTVERARFLEVPARMADMMLLSSAKTWLFTPALKDGQPVRYRTVLSWVGAP
jgi:hypothetical protein